VIAEASAETVAPVRPRTPWWRFAVPVVLALAAVVAFLTLRPDLIFTANTPTGGDMGAHVYLPAFLRDNLLAHGRILGWSNDWYAGFPVLYFYFPLPALVTVLLDVFLPYGVAFKLVTVAGLVALPFAAYFLARAMGLARPIALVAGVAGGTFIFMESFTIFGGNTLSTLAGEFSFSWSFALSLVYLGLVIRNVREGRRFSVSAGVVLALTALCHIITTMVVVVASLPLLLRRRGPSTLLLAWGIGFALAGFWAVPLLDHVPFTTDMGWFPVEGWDKVFQRELWPLLVPALAGLAWAIHRRMLVGPIVALMVVPVAGYYLIQFIDFRKLYNARLLAYWYFAVYFLAGVGIGAAVQAVARRLRGGESPRWALATVAAVAMLILGVSGVNKTPSWARWNYSGYEGKQAYGFTADGTPVLQADYWAELMGLMGAIDTLPPGRVMWEANSDLNRYGTPMALMLTPYFSEGHPSMEGLYFESALTTPFHFLNAAEVSQRPSNPVSGLNYHGMDFDRAIPHLAVYDVAYYVSLTEEATTAAKDYGLEVLAEPAPFTVFALPESDLVEVADYEPVVWAGEESFFEATLTWYDDVELLDRWLVETGPDEWLRLEDASNGTRRIIAEPATVSNVVLDHDRISFDTTAVGVPHLVKVSYFPNWRARGAEGPFRAAPSLMVVVPTQEHVEIVFSNTRAEIAGNLMTGATLLGLVGYAVVTRRRRRAAADAPATFAGS
jgi:hypothetical protein